MVFEIRIEIFGIKVFQRSSIDQIYKFDNPTLIYLIFKNVVAKYRQKHCFKSIVCFLKNSKNCIRLRLRTLKYA